MAASVNYVWNYCNETSYNAIKKDREWLSNYDLHKLTAGCSKELNLYSESIQKICDKYVINRKQFKKNK